MANNIEVVYLFLARDAAGEERYVCETNEDSDTERKAYPVILLPKDAAEVPALAATMSEEMGFPVVAVRFQRQADEGSPA